MKLKIHRSFPYKKVRVLGYTGPPGSGLSLAMTVQAYNELKNNPLLKVISNFTLNLPYEHFDPQKVDTYQDSLILIDLAELLIDARIPARNATRPFWYLLSTLRPRNNRLVLSYHHRHFLDPHVRNSIELELTCGYFEEHKILFRYLQDSLGFWNVYPIQNVNKYFHLYNTTVSIPGINALMETLATTMVATAVMGAVSSLGISTSRKGRLEVVKALGNGKKRKERKEKAKKS